ncbi:MAG: hypothetical protein M3R24_12005 [Chloroflexota bacterium]|nr:hypothetical protein [Chloroflexota bacterium]
MRDIPKRVKRLLREQAARAYEAELRRALLPLAEAFEQWKAGQIESGNLCQLIHEFHQGPARELYTRYNAAWLDMVVARAIADGLLDRQEVPAEVLDYLRPVLALHDMNRPP